MEELIEKLNHPLHIKNGITGIANELKYTPQYLCHYFKKCTGVTMTDYVNKIKLNRIAFYLTNTNMPLREIANSVGIKNLSYMNKLFVSRFGVTPKNTV